MRLRLLNVGRGDCILLQFPDMSWAVIDCGETASPYQPHNQVAGFLNNEKPTDTPVRFILATHPDCDHDGGIRQLFDLVARDIRAVYYSGVERRSCIHCGETREEEVTESFVAEAKRRVESGEIREFRALKSGEELEFSDPPLAKVHVSVLWPTEEIVDVANSHYNLARQHILRNNVSVVLKIIYGESVIILPGDIQGQVVCGKVFGALGSGGVRVIKAPHHGSQSSIVPWDKVPYVEGNKYVMISCPSNSEKHPHFQFLSSIPKGDDWQPRCTGLAAACVENQEPVRWPISEKDVTYLSETIRRSENIRRSFSAIGKRGRTLSLYVNKECCINNEVTISEIGELRHLEFGRIFSCHVNQP